MPNNQGPEGKEVDLAQTFAQVTGEPIVWVRKPQWIDGEIHRDLPGESAANFLYRTIRSEREATIKLALGSDDAIRVYLNNEKALDRDVELAVAADQDTVEAEAKGRRESSADKAC